MSSELQKKRVQAALDRLSPEERFIIERRVMSDRPATLGELGEQLAVSREQARLLELRAKARLRAELGV